MLFSQTADDKSDDDDDDDDDDDAGTGLKEGNDGR